MTEKEKKHKPEGPIEEKAEIHESVPEGLDQEAAETVSLPLKDYATA